MKIQQDKTVTYCVTRQDKTRDGSSESTHMCLVIRVLSKNYQLTMQLGPRTKDRTHRTWRDQETIKQMNEMTDAMDNKIKEQREGGITDQRCV